MAKKGREPVAEPEVIEAAQALADSGKTEGGDDDQSEQVALQETALDRLENTVNEVTLGTASLVADVTETILELFKRRPKPWSACSPQEQRDVAKVAQFAAKELVKNIVTVVAANNRPSIRATLDGISVTDKIVGKFKLNSLPEDQMAETLAELYHANRKTILIITADSGEYETTNRDPVEPEEPELQFAGDIGEGSEVEETEEGEEAEAGETQDADGDVVDEFDAAAPKGEEEE